MEKSSRKRILMISTHGYVSARPTLGMPDTGGQVVYVLELSKELARRGFSVDIATRQFEGQPPCEEVDQHVRVVRYPCGGDKFIPKETLHEHLGEWVDGLIDAARASGTRYDVINSHYWDAGVAGHDISGRIGVPHVHTPHSLGVWKRDRMHGRAKDLEREYNFRTRIGAERRICRHCDLVTVTTRQQFDLLQASEYAVPPESVRLIPAGYDQQRFHPVTPHKRSEIRERLGLSGKVVLAVGRLARNKGFDLLIRAFATVMSRHNAWLVLPIISEDAPQGEGRQLDELQALAEEIGVEPRVVFCHHLPDESLADWYRAADLFALSSRYEPFGMTAIEAMGCGTPAVVTTRGGLRDSIEWGIDGLCADPRDPQAFGHAMCMVLQFPELAARLSTQGVRKVASQFTWSAIADRFIDLLDELDSRRTTPPAQVERSRRANTRLKIDRTS